MHELGHVIGYDHADDEEDLMSPTFQPGIRRLLDLDAVFAEAATDLPW